MYLILFQSEKNESMKNINNLIIIVLLIAISYPNFGYAQEGGDDELMFEVNRIYPVLSISKETLQKANSLIDLNRHYKSSWIREYVSVEIIATCNGHLRKAVHKNDVLSPEQKEVIQMADSGTEISVNVKYWPENTLAHNDIKEMDFTFIIDPQCEAKYSLGYDQLKAYIKENAIDKIPAGSLRAQDLAAIKFTINEEGKIVNAYIFESTKSDKIDQLLLKTIRDMPSWEPAEYSNGIKVKQEFVLTVGNMESCVINLLNINQD